MIQWKTRNDLDRAIIALCDEQPLTSAELNGLIANVTPTYIRRRLAVLRRNEAVSYDASSRTWNAGR